MTRIEKRQQKRDWVKNKINQQYSYTSRESIATFIDLRKNFDWLPSKNGLSIEQFWLDRISQQHSASNLTKNKPLGCFGVYNKDIKLDDKIRKHICNSEYHQEVEFNNNDGQGTEWILTFVGDIYEELGFYPECVDDILGNEEFMELWYARIQNSKQSYFEKDQIVRKIYKLKPLQKQVVYQMVKSGKKYHILGLCPRFGKTLTVLEYLKRKVLSGEYSKEETWLIPASKSLASNTSIINDYTDFGFSKYFNVIKDVSLFVDGDKIIEKLKLTLPSNAKLCLVTDEGDLASHTENSTEKIDLVKSQFDVGEQIVMTGTGIGKATKIFKEVPSKDIFQVYVTYTELVEAGGDVVKRNFINVQYDIESGKEEVLNIRQSASDPSVHLQLAKYIADWTIDEKFEKRYNLQSTEIVMVFIKPDTNKRLSQLVNLYEKQYGGQVKCLILTGIEGANNKEAEAKVKKEYQTMRKNSDTRKLIVFSAGIGSRSFSVPKIKRVINFIDGELTNASVQENARDLTWGEGKKIADTIRIGFTPMEFAEQLYLIENEIPNYGSESQKRIKMFVENNSFTNLTIMGNGNQIHIPVENVAELLDNILKFSDTTNYLKTRLIGEELVVDVDPSKRNKNFKTKIVNTSISTNKKNKKGNNIPKISREDERKLEQYINIVRCIPSLANMVGIVSIEEFISSNQWEELLDIDKFIFQENYNTSEEFKGIVDNLFEQNKGKDKEDIDQRLSDYMKYVS